MSAEQAEIRKIISQVYYDPVDGFQNIARTLASAQELDPTILRSDVQGFMSSQKATQVTARNKGYNSFVPQQEGHQMQFDLAFASRFPGKSPYKYAFIAIDSFSK